jgi:hypothetical protein
MKKFITVIGGCHVEGFKIGLENSFPYKIKKYLESEYEIFLDIKSYVNFESKSYLQNFGNQISDIYIFQLGNYEFSGSLKFYLLKKFNISSKIKYVSNTNNEEQNNGINSYYKYSLNIVHFLSGYSLFPINYLSKNIYEFKKSIESVESKKIILMMPFPAINFITNKYRERGTKLLLKIFDDYKYNIFNTIEIFDKCGIHKSELFMDPYHLNLKGHEILGKKLAGYIWRLMDNSQGEKSEE